MTLLCWMQSICCHRDGPLCVRKILYYFCFRSFIFATKDRHTSQGNNIAHSFLIRFAMYHACAICASYMYVGKLQRYLFFLHSWVYGLIMVGILLLFWLLLTRLHRNTKPGHFASGYCNTSTKRRTTKQMFTYYIARRTSYMCAGCFCLCAHRF